MKKTIFAVAVLILLNAVGHARAVEPSFDCAKASNRVEREICRSDKLARQDLKLSRLYNNVMDKLTDDVKAETKAEQRAWLKSRNKECNLYGNKAEQCLMELYRERNTELSAMMAFDSSNVSTDKELKILRITPKGNDVPAGRQVVFQFDRPVVPIGRMERDQKDIPVTISPLLNCEWRWLNTSALACQLREEDAMTQATEYEIVMKPGITAENGARLSREVSHSFTTTRPKVTCRLICRMIP